MDKPLPENAARRAALKRHVVLKGGSLADDAGPRICATIATDREVRVRTISHRELRNNSAEVLRAVGAGETIEVTNHGEVAAVLVPPSLTPYERLAAAGKIREPRKDRPVDLRSIRRVSAPLSSAEIIADVRGDR
jgi:prevent-host-death family protein